MSATFRPIFVPVFFTCLLLARISIADVVVPRKSEGAVAEKAVPAAARRPAQPENQRSTERDGQSLEQPKSSPPEGPTASTSLSFLGSLPAGLAPSPFWGWLLASLPALLIVNQFFYSYFYKGDPVLTIGSSGMTEIGDVETY